MRVSRETKNKTRHKYKKSSIFLKKKKIDIIQTKEEWFQDSSPRNQCIYLSQDLPSLQSHNSKPDISHDIKTFLEMQ